MSVPRPELLAVVEEALVEHRAFGDSAYILEQLEVAFTRRLARIGQDLPAAEALLAAFQAADARTRYRLAGNTVLRCAVQHAYIRLETGKEVGLAPAESQAVIESVLAHLVAGRPGTPYENGGFALERLGPEWFHGWVWRDDYPDDALGRAFRKILRIEYGGPLCTIGAEELAMLRQGEALLRELLPRLGESALTHAHQVACFPDLGFWKGKVSSSQIRMGGTIFLNRHMLRNPWCTAEHLLHESLHQKLYDFRHGHSLLDADAPQDDAPRVVSLWNAQEFNQANHWDTHRAFAAFHVYAQLALLASVAQARAPQLEARYGRFCGMVESRKALDRARYLGEQLQLRCASHLGAAGLRMRDWLMTVLDHLDPAPPPPGATIHLLLDLYVREANRVEAALGGDEAVLAGFARELVPAAQAELEAARQILREVATQAQRAQFESELQARVGTDFARNFPALRRLVATTLLGAAPDGCTLGAEADQAVRRMVEAGSDALYLMQANVPRAVAAAKRRAKELRFASACQDEVGRLLAVLAAAVPPGARVLEIGTGVGVGLAWIATGLRARGDVEVLGIEGDLRLAAAASAAPWPEGFRLLVGDACELLPTLGRFDLVFADAAPVKYGDLQAMLDLLKPAGVLLVDDLCVTPQASEQELAQRDGLRLALLRHPQLQAVELDWSTRVIVATRAAPA